MNQQQRRQIIAPPSGAPPDPDGPRDSDRRYIRMRRTSTRGLINFLQIERDRIARDEEGPATAEYSAEVLRELAMLDRWLRELRTAVRRFM